MNCPNCGAELDLKNRHCTYCDTTFTAEELSAQSSVHTKTEVKAKKPEPEEPKTMTEKKQEELRRERQERAKTQVEADGREVAIGAAVMGIMGLFSGVRSFFRNLKRTVCILLLIVLEVGFAFLMISGYVTDLMESDIQGFIAVNIIILANALVAGLISRIGRVRIGTPLVAVVNFLAVLWVFAYPLIVTNFEGVTPQYVAILAVIEMAVLALSVLLSHLIYRR